MDYIDKPQFVFVLGGVRCGKKLIKCLLDDHPDMLVWPLEFAYFTYFWEITRNKKKPLISDLNEFILSIIFKNAGLKYKNYEQSDNSLFWGDLDLSLFQIILNTKQTQRTTPTEYLYHLFNAYHQAHSKYRNKPVKYYVILCSSQGFDWRLDNLINQSLFIIPYREYSECYQSIRQKRSKNLRGLINYYWPSRIKGALYWIYLFSYINERHKENKQEPNFHYISLKNLQVNFKVTITELCKFLNINNLKILAKPTILGEIYEGNMQDNNKGYGTIEKHSSSYKLPLLTLEDLIFSNMKLHNKDISYSYADSNIIKLVYISSFHEIPISDLYMEYKFGKIKSLFVKCVLFSELSILYYLSKYRSLSSLIFPNNKYMLSSKKLLTYSS